MSKYKKYGEEYKINYKFSDSKKYFSYPITSRKILNSYSYVNPNLHEINNIYYASTEPTERNVILPTNIPTNIPTNVRATYCPTNKNLTTVLPTNYNNNNNNNNNLTTVFIISFTTIFISLCLFIAYFYRYYLKYKKIKKELKQIKQDKLDLEFGVSYIEDI